MQNKYAFLVKIDNNKDLYEVFDIVNISDINPESFYRWSNGFSFGNVEIVEIANDAYINIGAEWDGNSCIQVDNLPSAVFSDDKAPFGLISDNKLFGLMVFTKNSFQHTKYHAAISQKVIGLDITDKQVVLGDIWDGNSFVNGVI